MPEVQEKRQKDAWDKLSIFSGFLASVLVPIAVAVVGNWYATAIKEKEAEISARDQKIRQDTFDREWVQLGLEILRDPDTAPNIRKWGVQIVSNYAKVKMEDDVKQAFTAGAVLPEASPAPLTAQQALPQAQTVLPSATSRVSAMDQLQTRGIEALLARDLEGAIAAYDEAYRLWPTFRNVDEIRRALIAADAEARSRPQGVDWQKLLQTIAKLDLRGVTQEAHDRLSAAGGG